MPSILSKRLRGKMCTYASAGGKGRLGKREGRIEGEGTTKRTDCEAGGAKRKQIGQQR